MLPYGNNLSGTTAAAADLALQKALTAGFGTDSAQFLGGRALIIEDCEGTMVNAMREQPEDCKLFNTLKKGKMSSTVHQYNRRNGTGDYRFGFTSEMGNPIEKNQDITREFVNSAFVKVLRGVSYPMTIVDSFEDAYASEKLAGIMDAIKSAEYACFHGDKSVVGTEWDGLPAIIKKLPAKQRHVKDARGQTIGTLGDKVFGDMATEIFNAGGMANKVFYPVALTQDIQALAQDKVRYLVNDRKSNIVVDLFQTAYGQLSILNDAGPDKLYIPKGMIEAAGDSERMPNPPASVTLSAGDPASGSTSQFLAADAGNYTYGVHAVNEYGISKATNAGAAVSVAAGQAVTLTITPDSVKPGTGFIITRSGKDGSVLMEMIRIGQDTENAATTYDDLNGDLPGTAEMLFMTEQKIQMVAEFRQLLPITSIPLPLMSSLVQPFVIALFGAPLLKVPEWCGLVKNIQYPGGLVY